MIRLVSYDEFNERLKSQASVLSYEKGIHLTRTISQLLFPDYLSFCEKHQRGDPARLLQGMGLIASAIPGAISIQLLDGLMKEIANGMPDTENFGNWDGSYALNAAVCIYYSLEYLKKRDPKELFSIGTCYTDTVDFKLREQWIEGDVEIDKHPLMQEARQLLLQLSV
jgi:hypothetical protein